MNRANIFQIIKRYWYTAPVDVVAIIRDAGLEYREELLHPDISGMVEKVDDGRYSISVNVRDSRLRKRFTTAHELGHYIYHRDLIGDGVDDNRVYRSVEAGRYFNRRITNKHETEANQFAANLLMPKHLIEALRSAGIHRIADLAHHLGVSIPAMRVRMGYPPYPEANEGSEGVDEDADDHAAL